MGRGLSAKWQKLHRTATTRARRLVHALTLMDLPVRLRPIADAQHAHVTFQPLLVEAGISTVNGGFEIYANCRAGAVRNLMARFDDPEDGGRSFPHRLRFTLAHELAHTFFFDWRGNDHRPQPHVSGTHYAELDSLERECNTAAGLLLVPERLLSSMIDINNIDTFDPTAIRSVAERFAVSADCLLICLRSFLATRDVGGGILVVGIDKGLPHIQAHALDSTATQMFMTAEGVLDLNLIEQNVPIPNHGQRDMRREVQVPCRLGGRLAVQVVSITVTHTSAIGHDQRSLVGIKFVGRPQLAQ